MQNAPTKACHSCGGALKKKEVQCQVCPPFLRLSFCSAKCAARCTNCGPVRDAIRKSADGKERRILLDDGVEMECVQHVLEHVLDGAFLPTFRVKDLYPGVREEIWEKATGAGALRAKMSWAKVCEIAGGLTDPRTTNRPIWWSAPKGVEITPETEVEAAATVYCGGTWGKRSPHALHVAKAGTFRDPGTFEVAAEDGEKHDVRPANRSALLTAWRIVVAGWSPGLGVAL